MDLVVDSTGRLYIAPVAGTIQVYNDPVHSWHSPDGQLGTEGEEGGQVAPMAVDESLVGVEDIYFQTWVQGSEGPWGAADHAKRSALALTDQISQTRECNASGGFMGQEISMAVDKNYLMFTCYDTGYLYVYRNVPGKQRAVEALPGGLGILIWP